MGRAEGKTRLDGEIGEQIDKHVDNRWWGGGMY